MKYLDVYKQALSSVEFNKYKIYEETESHIFIESSLNGYDFFIDMYSDGQIILSAYKDNEPQTISVLYAVSELIIIISIMTNIEFEDLIDPTVFFNSTEDFINFINTNDTWTENSYIDGLTALLKICEKKELYEYCAIVRDKIIEYETA